MRQLAMRFPGILQSKHAQRLEGWLHDAHRSGMRAIQWFARTLRRDTDAVGNVLSKRWRGQTERQINRLKTLKRARYGHASHELLRARMLPLHAPIEHRLRARPNNRPIER